jgi:hypothetical protein
LQQFCVIKAYGIKELQLHSLLNFTIPSSYIQGNVPVSTEQEEPENVFVVEMLHLLRYHNSLIQFHLKTKRVWRFNVAGKNKKYLGLHIKRPNSTKPGISKHIFTEDITIKFHINPSSGNRAAIGEEMDGRTDGRTDERIEENNESNNLFLPSCRKANHGFSNP